MDGSGRGPSDAEIADAEERRALRARGQKGELPAAYRARIGPPPICRPGDHEAARRYLDRILSAIDDGGWTRSEWSRLCKLRDKWQARAEGRSPRFEAVGTKVGGLTDRERMEWEGRMVSAQAHKIIDELGGARGDKRHHRRQG